jgi:hypothetical protein
MKKLTASDIVNQVISTFSKPNSRSIEDGTGKFKSSDGKRCAVGLFMTDEAARKYGKTEFASIGIARMLKADRKKFDEILKPEAQGQSVQFWDRLENLHDEDSFYNEEGGFNKAGEKYATQLVKDFTPAAAPAPKAEKKVTKKEEVLETEPA